MAMADYDLSDLAAVTGNANNDGWGGNGSWWILLLFILLGGWGWNRNQGGAGSAGGDVLYPWMENQAALCNGFAGVTAAITNGFANAETAATARQMADTQAIFGLQTAMMQGFNAQQAQQASCCCENRVALANLNATIAAENCADRQAISDGIRDLLVNANSNTQRILDQMCQDKIDAKNDEIQQLRTQLQVQNLAASQTAQTAQILADNAAQTAALEQYLNPAPIPAYQVANPNCCQQNFGCGCGM